MIFLDTNAFYYGANLSVNNDVDLNKLQLFINQNETAISSVSLYEFFVKYHNYIDIIHKGFTYIKNNDIKIVYNKYFPFKKELFADYSKINCNQFKEKLNLIIADKINVESRFASIVFDRHY